MDPTVTLTEPLDAVAGKIATICVSLQLWTLADVPKKSTELLVCVAPNPAPEIITGVPAGPEFGETPVMERFSTEKETLLLVTPPSVAVSGPLVAPVGTLTVMLVSLQL